jgi:hypothetical protein
MANAFEAKLRQVQPGSKQLASERNHKVASGLCPEEHCGWYQRGRHCVLPCCFKKKFDNAGKPNSNDSKGGKSDG